MRTVILSAVLLGSLISSIGCVLPIYSSSRDARARQLIYTSENFRQIVEIWDRIWFLDHPDFETPYRTYGGVI